LLYWTDNIVRDYEFNNILVRNGVRKCWPIFEEFNITEKFIKNPVMDDCYLKDKNEII